jgi:predicted hotdog family 3-hydroxylacyl-ACP dehydratase
MPTLKKYSDFQSLKADTALGKKASLHYAAQRNGAWMAFLKALQQAKKIASANFSGNGTKLLKYPHQDMPNAS